MLQELCVTFINQQKTSQRFNWGKVQTAQNESDSTYITCNIVSYGFLPVFCRFCMSVLQTSVVAQHSGCIQAKCCMNFIMPVLTHDGCQCSGYFSSPEPHTEVTQFFWKFEFQIFRSTQLWKTTKKSVMIHINWKICSKVTSAMWGERRLNVMKKVKKKWEKKVLIQHCQYSMKIAGGHLLLFLSFTAKPAMWFTLAVKEVLWKYS